MSHELIRELKELVEKAYELSNDSKISMYLRIRDIIDIYDPNISTEYKNKLIKEYNYKLKKGE